MNNGRMLWIFKQLVMIQICSKLAVFTIFLLFDWNVLPVLPDPLCSSIHSQLNSYVYFHLLNLEQVLGSFISWQVVRF